MDMDESELLTLLKRHLKVALTKHHGDRVEIEINWQDEYGIETITSDFYNLPPPRDD